MNCCTICHEPLEPADNFLCEFQIDYDIHPVTLDTPHISLIDIHSLPIILNSLDINHHLYDSASINITTTNKNDIDCHHISSINHSKPIPQLLTPLDLSVFINSIILTHIESPSIAFKSLTPTLLQSHTKQLQTTHHYDQRDQSGNDNFNFHSFLLCANEQCKSIVTSTFFSKLVPSLQLIHSLHWSHHLLKPTLQLVMSQIMSLQAQYQEELHKQYQKQQEQQHQQQLVQQQLEFEQLEHNSNSQLLTYQPNLIDPSLKERTKGTFFHRILLHSMTNSLITIKVSQQLLFRDVHAVNELISPLIHTFFTTQIEQQLLQINQSSTNPNRLTFDDDHYDDDNDYDDDFYNDNYEYLQQQMQLKQFYTQQQMNSTLSTNNFSINNVSTQQGSIAESTNVHHYPTCPMCDSQFITLSDLFQHIYTAFSLLFDVNGHFTEKCDEIINTEPQPTSQHQSSLPIQSQTCSQLSQLFSHLHNQFHIPTQILSSINSIISTNYLRSEHSIKLSTTTKSTYETKLQHFKKNITLPNQFQMIYISLLFTICLSLISSPIVSPDQDVLKNNIKLFVSTTISPSPLQQEHQPTHISPSNQQHTQFITLIASVFQFSYSLLINSEYLIFFRLFFPFFFPSIQPPSSTTTSSNPPSIYTNYIFPLQSSLYQQHLQFDLQLDGKINTITNFINQTPSHSESTFFLYLINQIMNDYTTTMSLFDGSITNSGYFHPNFGKLSPTLFSQFTAPIIDIPSITLYLPVVVRSYIESLDVHFPQLNLKVIFQHNNLHQDHFHTTHAPNEFITNTIKNQYQHFYILTPITFLQQFQHQQYQIVMSCLQDIIIPSSVYHLSYLSMQFHQPDLTTYISIQPSTSLIFSPSTISNLDNIDDDSISTVQDRTKRVNKLPTRTKLHSIDPNEINELDIDSYIDSQPEYNSIFSNMMENESEMNKNNIITKQIYNESLYCQTTTFLYATLWSQQYTSVFTPDASTTLIPQPIEPTPTPIKRPIKDVTLSNPSFPPQSLTQLGTMIYSLSSSLYDLTLSSYCDAIVLKSLHQQLFQNTNNIANNNSIPQQPESIVNYTEQSFLRHLKSSLSLSNLLPAYFPQSSPSQNTSQLSTSNLIIHHSQQQQHQQQQQIYYSLFPSEIHSQLQSTILQWEYSTNTTILRPNKVVHSAALGENEDYYDEDDDEYVDSELSESDLLLQFIELDEDEDEEDSGYVDLKMKFHQNQHLNISKSMVNKKNQHEESHHETEGHEIIINDRIGNGNDNGDDYQTQDTVQNDENEQVDSDSDDPNSLFHSLLYQNYQPTLTTTINLNYGDDANREDDFEQQTQQSMSYGDQNIHYESGHFNQYDQLLQSMQGNHLRDQVDVDEDDGNQLDNKNQQLFEVIQSDYESNQQFQHQFQQQLHHEQQQQQQQQHIPDDNSQAIFQHQFNMFSLESDDEDQEQVESTLFIPIPQQINDNNVNMQQQIQIQTQQPIHQSPIITEANDIDESINGFNINNFHQQQSIQYRHNINTIEMNGIDDEEHNLQQDEFQSQSNQNELEYQERHYLGCERDQYQNGNDISHIMVQNQYQDNTNSIPTQQYQTSINNSNQSNQQLYQQNIFMAHHQLNDYDDEDDDLLFFDENDQTNEQFQSFGMDDIHPNDFEY